MKFKAQALRFYDRAIITCRKH